MAAPQVVVEPPSRRRECGAGLAVTYFWIISVYDDTAGEDDAPQTTMKGSGSIQELTQAIVRVALDMDEEADVLSISVDPIPERVVAE